MINTGNCSLIVTLLFGMAGTLVVSSLAAEPPKERDVVTGRHPEGYIPQSQKMLADSKYPGKDVQVVEQAPVGPSNRRVPKPGFSSGKPSICKAPRPMVADPCPGNSIGSFVAGIGCLPSMLNCGIHQARPICAANQWFLAYVQCCAVPAAQGGTCGN